MINKLTNIYKLNNVRNICSYSFPLRAYWNKDWLAGPYPKTEDELRAAAEKYNLHPKEYKAYADDGFGFGDYPKLPFEGVATRDIHYPYDHPEHRRNFNEPIHIDIDMLGEDRYDAGMSERYSNKFILASFIIIFGTFIGSCCISRYIPTFQPVVEKQYPWTGKTYYTFEEK